MKLKPILKPVLHVIEAILFFSFYLLFKLIPVGATSFALGKLLKSIGPFFSVNKTSILNLKKAFPEKSEAEIKTINKEMWENLGRLAGEMPHIKQIIKKRNITIENFEAYEKVKKLNKGIIFVSAHYGNWELFQKVAKKYGEDVTLIYRHINNPYLEKWIKNYRTGKYPPIQKGRRSVRMIYDHINNGEHIGMLADQKTGEGIEIDFMGHPAMALTSYASLAIKLNAPIVAGVIERVNTTDFKFVLHDPILPPQNVKDQKKEIRKITEKVNELFEEDIKRNPSQWFWVHDKWSHRKKLNMEKSKK